MENMREIDGRIVVDVTDAFAAVVVRRTDEQPEDDGATPIEIEAWASGITRGELAHVFRAAADHWASQAALDEVLGDGEVSPEPTDHPEPVSAPSSP